MPSPDVRELTIPLISRQFAATITHSQPPRADPNP